MGHQKCHWMEDESNRKMDYSSIQRIKSHNFSCVEVRWMSTRSCDTPLAHK
jgi:hypothetical protein